MCSGSIIEKTRHVIPVGNHSWEVDVFHGDNGGLVVAEVELSSEGEHFERPDWLAQEVSDDPRYLNALLVSAPYCGWDKSTATTPDDAP